MVSHFSLVLGVLCTPPELWNFCACRIFPICVQKIVCYGSLHFWVGPMEVAPNFIQFLIIFRKIVYFLSKFFTFVELRSFLWQFQLGPEATIYFGNPSYTTLLLPFHLLLIKFLFRIYRHSSMQDLGRGLLIVIFSKRS